MYLIKFLTTLLLTKTSPATGIATTMIHVMQVCIIIFSEQPPVYSRPKEAAQLPYPAAAGPYGGYPGMPPQPGIGAQQQQPPPPYPPAAAAYPPYPVGGSAGYRTPYPPTTNSNTPGYLGYGATPYPPPHAGASYQTQVGLFPTGRID